MKLFFDNGGLCFGEVTAEVMNLCEKTSPRNRLFAHNSGLRYLGATSEAEFLRMKDSAYMQIWLEAHRVTSVMPFISHPAVEEACKALGIEYLAPPGYLTQQYRSKHELYRLCQRLNLPTLPTLFINSGESYTPDSMMFAKHDISAGSLGNTRIPAGMEFQARVNSVLQPCITVVGSPSVQVEFNNGDYRIVAVIDQIMKDGYSGLRYPSSLSESQEAQARMIGHMFAWEFKESGMKNGRFSLDFYLDDQGTLWPGDLNLRHGGVSEPARVLMETNSPAMLVHQSVVWGFEEPPVFSGVGPVRELVPYNPATGKVGVIVLGDTLLQCEEELTQFTSQVGVLA